jgi:hypothetical protein
LGSEDCRDATSSNALPEGDSRDGQIAFEDTPDGALAVRLHEVVCDQYGGDTAHVPLEDTLHAAYVF